MPIIRIIAVVTALMILANFGAPSVYEARRRLNFSAWQDYASDSGTEDLKLDEIAHLIADNKMAPWYYRAIHPEARLSGPGREVITRWIAGEKFRLSPPNSNAARRRPQ